MGHSITKPKPREDITKRKNWKLVRRTLLAIVVLCTLFTSLYFNQLQQHFDEHRISTRLAQEQLLNSLNKQSAQHLQQLFNVITSLDGVHDSLLTQNTRQLETVFDKHWANMEYDWNLDYIEFYSPTSHSLGKWSSRPLDTLLVQKINGWVQSVIQNNEPLTLKSCIQTCSQYLIAPIETNGGNKAVMIVAVSLLDILNTFQLNSDNAIGILTPAQNAETSTDMLVYKWGYELFDLTEAGKNEPLLQEFTKSFTPTKGLKQTFSSDINHQHFELNFFPLTPFDDSSYIVLEEITEEVTEIYQATLQFSAIFFITLLVLQLILMFTLKKLLPEPSQSLDLSEHQISTSMTVRDSDQTLPEQTHLTNTDTPIDFDLTSENVISITERLEQLKKYNQDINLELANQMISLSKERDQVRKILDNTQAIIMTLHEDGSIASINRYGELITGYSSQELRGKSFIDLYPEKVPFALNNLQTMSAIANGQKDTYRHEARMSCKDGKERVILWLHSRLNSEHDNNTPLLSAGLDITEHKQLEKNLSWLADHDSLTSLFNRRRFEEELEDALNWATTHQANGALLYIDLDNFKDINDSCGHQVGDVILRKVANTLTKLTSDIDSSAHLITARLGGDEFAIILRNIDEEGVSILSKRILDSLYQIQHNEENFRFQLSCSIGITCFPGVESCSNELLTNADFAMYQAKMLGRNQYYMFKEDDSHREQTHHRMIWREKIEHALSNNRFVLHYQPILDIQQRTISHYETLIRMLDDNDELISPGVFINIAERLGLIQEIDTFILQSAIKKQADLTLEGHDITLAINLSGKAFDDPNLSENIKAIIDTNQAKPENLIFEITETAAVSDIVAAEKTMLKIQALGCQFALDDFGVGFSSFYYLRELPVEYVKIDGSFVTDLPNNSDNEILVRALSEVAIGFNKLTVAEFVDSLQTLHILGEAKVNFAQGYFIGKPSEKIPVEPPNFYQASIRENTAII